MTPFAAPTRVERYLAHLDRVSGGIEPLFLPEYSTTPGLPGVTAITYPDTPEPGMLTAITYGLSLADHSEWVTGKPELCLSVRSADPIWARALAYLAERQRGHHPFCYGSTLDFGQPISGESPMTGFVFFAPAVLDPNDYLDIDVAEHLPVNITGAYPIHDSEHQYIQQHGLEAFWHREWDPYDVTRAPVA